MSERIEMYEKHSAEALRSYRERALWAEGILKCVYLMLKDGTGTDEIIAYLWEKYPTVQRLEGE